MATILKEIKYPSNDLTLEILRYSKDESPRDKKAIIHFECGFDFEKTFTQKELKELGRWLIHQSKKLESFCKPAGAAKEL
jgi:hypothetical protein